MSANTDKPDEQREYIASQGYQYQDCPDCGHLHNWTDGRCGLQSGECDCTIVMAGNADEQRFTVPTNQHRCDKCQHQCATCSQFIDPFFDRVHSINVWAHTETAANEATPDHVAVPTCAVIRTTPMQVTKTVQFTLDFTFSAKDQAKAKAEGNKRGVSQHKVLTERMRREAARVLRNGGFLVDAEYTDASPDRLVQPTD